MAKKTKKKLLPVSERAIMLRINRKLSPELQMLRKSRGPRAWSNVGDYYLVDTNRSFVIGHHIDLEDFGRELDVLGLCEEVANE